MSGHSKWSTIKRKKGVEDRKRGQIFTKLAHSITLAVKEGGGIDDPSSNFRLRLALLRAKQFNMPKENIKRAIERGTGKGSEGSNFSKIVYEGYGPQGVAMVIETTTDNSKRTSSQVKHILERGGGSLGGPGSVLYQFKQRGRIIVEKKYSEEKIYDAAIESGAEDIETREDSYFIYTVFEDVYSVKDKLEEKNIEIADVDIIYHPNSYMSVSEETKKKIEDLVDKLDELDDVQNVFVNIHLS